MRRIEKKWTLRHRSDFLTTFFFSKHIEMNIILILILVVILAIVVYLLSFRYIEYLAVFGGRDRPNRGGQIAELRKRYTVNDILGIARGELKTGQYNVNEGNLVFACPGPEPPYRGLLMIMNVKRVNSQLLADIMMSLAIREYAFVIVISGDSRYCLGATTRLEDITLGRTREFLVKY